MSKILITGASGHLGKATINYLLEKTDAANIVALVRDTAKAEELKQKGVEIRVGDYDNYASLTAAFAGINKVLFVSGSDIGRRIQQHENVVKAAKEAGVKHVVYTSFQRKNEGPDSPIAPVAEAHIKTEAWLRQSGLAYTILLNNIYMDILPMFIGNNVLETGIYFPAGDGKAAMMLRDDMAAACAAILATNGHENKTYDIAGDAAVSFGDIAAIIAEISGKPVGYVSPAKDEFINTLTGAGVPAELVHISAGFAEAVKQEEFAKTSTDFETLTGRKPVTAKQFLQQVFTTQAAK